MAHLSLTELFPKAFLNESTHTQSLGEEFTMCDNGNLVFHWADYHETCNSVKEKLLASPELKEEFLRKEAGLSRLSLIPVWIRTDKKVHQTTMFNLYERYILNQMQLLLGLDPLGPIEISFISGTGPYRAMAIAECFNKSTYKDFVMVYLLQDKLPKRDYRIRLKSKVLLEYGTSFMQADLINVEQLTMNGMLFSLDAEFFEKNISSSDQLRIIIDTQSLKEGIHKSLPELKAHLSQYAFNLLYSSSKEDSFVCSVKDLSIQSSFDFLKNRRVYLFISYHKLSASNAKILELQRFVDYTRNLVHEYYRPSSKKSA